MKNISFVITASASVLCLVFCLIYIAAKPRSAVKKIRNMPVTKLATIFFLLMLIIGVVLRII